MRGPAVFLGLLALTGCDRTPPPINKAKPVAAAPQATAFSLPTDPPPATSDPASKAVIDAALKAHTNGDPAKLDALKAARKTVSGTLAGPNGPVANEWTFTWRWPDRVRAEARVAGGPPIVIRRVGAAAWMTPQPGTPEQPLGGGHLTGVQAETFAECLLLLFPLTDSRAVFSPAADLTVRDKPAVGVRVSGPGWPTTVAHFDKESKRLVQLTYAGMEGESPMTKETLVLSETTVNGVTLPERLAVRWNGQEKGDWTLKGATFPAPAPDETFDKP